MNTEKPHCFNTSSGLLRQKRARNTSSFGGASPDVTHHSSESTEARDPRMNTVVVSPMDPELQLTPTNGVSHQDR